MSRFGVDMQKLCRGILVPSEGWVRLFARPSGDVLGRLLWSRFELLRLMRLGTEGKVEE